MRKQDVTKVNNGNELTRNIFISEHMEKCTAKVVRKYDNKKSVFAKHSLMYSKRKCAKNIYNDIMKRRNSLKNSKSSSDSRNSNNSKVGGDLPLSFADSLQEKIYIIFINNQPYCMDAQKDRWNLSKIVAKELEPFLAQERAATEERMRGEFEKREYKMVFKFLDHLYKVRNSKEWKKETLTSQVNQALRELKEGK